MRELNFFLVVDIFMNVLNKLVFDPARMAVGRNALMTQKPSLRLSGSHSLPGRYSIPESRIGLDMQSQLCSQSEGNPRQSEPGD